MLRMAASSNSQIIGITPIIGDILVGSRRMSITSDN
jgi:hypothetical protein